MQFCFLLRRAFFHDVSDPEGRHTFGSMTTPFWIIAPTAEICSPTPHYKNLCDSSTRNLPYILSRLSTSPSCLPFPHWKASNTWFCELYQIESKEYDQICTDESFGLLIWEDQVPWRIFRTALKYLLIRAPHPLKREQSKEPHIHSKKTNIYSEEPHIHSKETRFHSKEIHIHLTQHESIRTSTMSTQERPTSTQKRQHPLLDLSKSPISTEKRPKLTERRSKHTQKSITPTQKSPVFTWKSPVSRQKKPISSQKTIIHSKKTPCTDMNHRHRQRWRHRRVAPRAGLLMLHSERISFCPVPIHTQTHMCIHLYIYI